MILNWSVSKIGKSVVTVAENSRSWKLPNERDRVFPQKVVSKGGKLLQFHKEN